MNISAPFILRPVMTTLCSIALVLAGMLAYNKLPVSDLPVVEYPILVVHTHYPGASCEVILDTVTIPLEKELALLKGVANMTSMSMQEASQITLEYDLNKNMDEAVQDLIGALHRAENELPDNLASKPTYMRQEKNQEPIISILISSDTTNVGELRHFADVTLVPRLKRIAGVAEAEIYGSEQVVHVKLNPELLTARNIGFNQVVDTIRAHTTQHALGKIEKGSKTLALQLATTLGEAKELEEVHILGTSIRLKDVAEVVEEPEVAEEFHFVTPKSVAPTISVVVQKTHDANVVAISHDVRKLVTSIQKELPAGCSIDVWFDKAIWIEQSIFDVKASLALAFFLVIVVIYMSLKSLKSAFVASAALPLSLVGTFAVMYWLGMSIDLLSLLALTLAVGFVVDDAIVVVENIVRHQESGKNRFQASLDGSKEISFTILSITLSLVAVFIPLLFMPGVNGRLFREFSVTLAVAICISGLLSLTVTPMLASRFLGGKEHKEQASLFTHLYKKSLDRVIQFPKTVLGITFLLIVCAYPLYIKLPVTFVPPEDRGLIWTVCSLPTGLSQQEFNRYQQKLEQLLQQNQYIDSFFDFTYGNHLMFLTKLVPHEKRPSQNEVISQIQTCFNATVGVQSFSRGHQLININMEFGTVGQYRYDLFGFNDESVIATCRQIASHMRNYPEFLMLDVSVKNDSPRLIIEYDDELLNRCGLSKQDIQELLQNAFAKVPVGSIQKGTHEQDIYMKLHPDYAKGLSSLSNLTLKTQDDVLVPLKTVISTKEAFSRPFLERREQMPAASIYIALADGVAANTALQKFDREAFKLLPADVSGQLAEGAQKIASGAHDMLLLLIAAACVMYIVLGILYESFIHPLTILSSLPFAGLGGVLTLALFSEPLSIFSGVGFLLLLGIVKKNGIMMIDYAIEAKNRGLTSPEAIIDGALARFRPIMMTTLAAIMGAIPIAIGIGEGAEMRRGLGLVIVGGLLFSQLLTLYVTPVIYLLFERFRRQ